MLVDDHHLVRQGMRELIDLEPGILVVAEAADGEEAIQAAETALPDVVVMDVHMPGMNGIDATRQLKQQHPHLRVLVVTMADDKQTLRSATEAGADLTLSKSVVSDELCSVLIELGNLAKKMVPRSSDS